jgi:hypothetical protein
MMIRAITAITKAAATKIAISSTLERPPLLDELLAGGATVTGPVLVLGVGAGVVVVGISDDAGLVAPAPAAPAGSASATNPATATTPSACRRRSLPMTIPRGRKIAAI